MIQITLPIFLLINCSKDAQPTSLMSLRGDLQIKGTVSGTIINSSGKPLSAVHVSIDNNRYTTVTLPNGDFSIPDIPAGNFSVSLKRFSYADTTLEDIELSVNQDLVLFDQIVMKSSKAMLSGRVTLNSGAPVGGAGITIASQPYITLSDESGKFGFTDLLSGEATVIAARKGVGWGETVVELLPDKQLSVSISLDKEGGKVKGRVLDEHGNGVEGEIVSAMGGGITDTTNENGEYLLINLPSTIPITVSAGPDRSIGGLRVSEGGTLAGADLVQVSTVGGHGIVLGNQTIISARRLPVKLSADLREDENGRIPIDSVAHFRWDVDNDGDVDTITSVPSLEILPSSDWQEEKNISYGIMTVWGDTVDGAKITVRRVSSLPVVDASALKTTLRTGEAGVFKGKAFSLDGNIVRYQWTFGDSSSWSRTDTSDVIHRYSRPGIYKARFTAITEDSSATDSIMVNVSGIHLGVALDTLELSGNITLDKPFHTDSLDYSATVPYETENLFLTTAALDSTSMVVLDKDTLKSGTPSDTIYLKVGVNEIRVRLVALDGAKGEYVVRILRQPNTDASLSKLLVLENGLERNVGFGKDTLNYRFGVSDTTTALTMIAGAADSLALITIGDEPDTIKAHDTVTVRLDGRETVTRIKVTAANRVDTRIYTLKAVRPPVLSSLTVSAGGEPIEFELESGQYVCSLEVGFTTESITIVPQKSEGTDLIIVDDDTLNTGEYTRPVNIGTDSISIAVVSLDNPENYSRKEYRLIVQRHARSEASLSSLRIDDENGDLLAQNFSPDSMIYDLDLPFEIDSISIAALSRDELASVTVDGDTIEPGETYPLLLSVGSDTIEIVVVSADGMVENTYTVCITRAANPNASLHSLSLMVEGDNRDISFSPSRFIYNIELPWYCDSFVLTPTPADPLASLSVNDSAISYGDSVKIDVSGPDTVKIRVVAPDQSAVHTYRLILTNAPVPIPAISEITVNVQEMEPVTFAKDTNEFEINVPYETETLVLTPTGADSAKVMVEGDTIGSQESATVVFGAQKDTIVLTAFYATPDTFSLYKIYVNRMLRSEAGLDSLAVTSERSGFTAQIDRDGNRFSTHVPFAADTVDIRLYPRDSNAGITVNDLPVDGSIFTAPLKMLNNSFDITVTAADGQTDSAYTLVVNRSGDSHSWAQMISIDGNDIPDFYPNVYTYNLRLGPDVKRPELVVVPQSENARISINGATPVTGTCSTTLVLSEEDNILIEVCSGDLTDTTYYSIRIRRTHYRLYVSAPDYRQSLSPQDDTLIAVGDSIQIRSLDPERYNLYRVYANGDTLLPEGGIVTLRNIRSSDTVEAVLNHIPEFTGELNLTTYRGREFSYVPAVADNDNDPLRFTVVDQVLPAGLQFNPETGEISGTPVYMGFWEIQLTVTDHKSPPVIIGPLRLEVGIEDVFLVKSGNDGLETGLSWRNAFTDIGQALDAARQRELPSQIWIAAGSYSPGQETQDCYQLCDGVELYGGFSGDEQNREERDVEANRVFVTGLYNQEPANSIIFRAAENALLDGLYINGAWQFEAEQAAAIYAYDVAGFRISSCEIYNNVSENGAAIYSYNSVMDIVGCVISDNRSTGEFGTASAIYATNGGLSIQNTLFYNNVFGDYIIHNRGGYTTLINCTVADNEGYVFAEGYCKVFNSVLYNSQENTQIRISSIETSLIGNCLIQGAFGGGIQNDGNGPVETEYLTDADPMFEDVGYAFYEGSWLADGGNSEYLDQEIQFDVYGNTRIQGECVDIGAVESPHMQPLAQLAILPSDFGSTEPSELISIPRYTELSVLARPNEDYAFAQWEIISGQPQIEDPFSDLTTVRVNGIEDVIQPIFARVYSLRVAAQNGGHLTCDSLYYLRTGDSVLISAEAEPGFSFTRWSIDGNVEVSDPSSPSTYVKLVDGSAWVGAVFDTSRIIYVSENGNDENDGLTWESAKRTVQAGIDGAALMEPTSEKPAEVWVAQGTYYPSIQLDQNDPRSKVFLLPRHINIYGGFRGSERDPSERVTVAGQYGDVAMVNETVLNGNGDSYRVVECDSIVMDGFTITGGNNDGSFFTEGGSAIFTVGATIRNCRIVDNISANCEYGSAIFIGSFGNVRIEKCYLGGNVSLNNPNKGGSAISLSNAQATITNCYFDMNQTDGSGGAIYAENGGYTIDGCAFTENTSRNNGGAIFSILSQYRYSVLNSIFESNTSDYQGGAILVLDSDLEFTNCTFHKNSSGSEGGGIMFDVMRQIALIENCIIYNNTSGWENPESDFEDQIVVLGENQPYVSHSCIQSETGELPFPGEGNITDDPLFEEGELRLTSESPCINSGNVQNYPLFDITGARRDRLPDMGAYEYRAQ